jgi:hypothetical protein
VALNLRDVAGLAATALADYGRPRVAEPTLIVRTLTLAICAFLAAAFGLAALGAGSVALWVFAMPYIGSLAAALVVAALWLIACAIMIAVTVSLLRPRPKPVATPALPPTEQLLAQGIQLVKDHKGAMLLAALIAGMVSADANRP